MLVWRVRSTGQLRIGVGFEDYFFNYSMCFMMDYHKEKTREICTVNQQHNGRQGLYNGEFRDNCGFGLLANVHGQASHDLLHRAIHALTCMTHRGGINADGKTGDGCGVLMQMPDAFVRKVSKDCFGYTLGEQYGFGMVFLSQNADDRVRMQEHLDTVFKERNIRVVGWRKVPVHSSSLGEIAQGNQPAIYQVLVEPCDVVSDDLFQKKLFAAGRDAESFAHKIGSYDFYICSLSSSVLSYKGLMMPADLVSFYPDLSDQAMASAICVFHQRFSTNTTPQWNLAQPFRYLAHNGEINTISANRNNIKARQQEIQCHLKEQGVAPFLPLIREDLSDSASFDQMLELMITGGVDMLRALRMMVPPAWEQDREMPDAQKAMHQYNSLFMEPWDGPAGLVVTDGRYAVCMLDRNGLRPARWSLGVDGIITIASEAGVGIAAARIEKKGRVGPGQMLVIDTQTGDIFHSDEVAERQASAHPYKQWLTSGLKSFNELLDRNSVTEELSSSIQLDVYRKMFALTDEERNCSVQQTAENKLESVGAMGDDAPMAVLSVQGRLLSDYFRQMFAQVTNPAIDPLREGVVMSLTTYIGGRQPLLHHGPVIGTTYALESPIITPSIFRTLISTSAEGISRAHLSLQYQITTGLQNALQQLQQQAEKEILDGATILILSDRDIVAHGVLPMNALLATGAVHHHLVRCGLRTRVSIIIETAFARDSHQCATFISVGATAVYPYLAFACISDLIGRGVISLPILKAYDNYVQGMNKGLLKIISKMGIACIASYRGSQLFEAVGIGSNVIDMCFSNMISRIGGADFDDIESQQKQWSERAWMVDCLPSYGGRHKWIHGGEYHAYNPEVVTNLRLAASTGESRYYTQYAEEVNQRPVATLRDLLRCKSDRKPIDLTEVEPVEAILKRFDSAAMSLGALSPEAHEALAQAMNELGARSNSGEGGEDSARYGTIKESKIKQIASGRFGVTASYLVHAEVLQIKVAQGAKPGEGGQLPGGKVTDLIARLRYSTPGTTLISPPPHHDIYSIEDLAQLIFDLKQVNPKAMVSVKLVAEPGIGTVASGVAKAYADFITVSGYDGGTAASPLSSINHAGSPWELGLSEVQQALRSNGLRSRVRLQTDGGLKTGLDVIKAALLGAESFGFGTATMIAMGCKYLRICHLNNCATGVATQDSRLREKHFVGTSDMVKNFFYFVAEEVRKHLASLGYASLHDIIGRVDLLQATTDMVSSQQKKLNLQPILAEPVHAADQPRAYAGKKNNPFDSGQLGQKMLHDCLPFIEKESGDGVVFEYAIKNSDRSCGAAVSGAIARKWGDQGLQKPVILRCTGVAGQSFGVWNNKGLELHLHGEANDYVGKGMSGGKIVIAPADPLESNAPIVGNTCLYGATGGVLFARGCAGERFAVRNSGACAVIEGAGDHCCEYMTGGIVVVLGATGTNFGAGMTGGLAFVLAEDQNNFITSCNTELIMVSKLDMESDAGIYLRGLLEKYAEATASVRARAVLEQFSDGQFCLVRGQGSVVEDALVHARKNVA